MANEVRIKLDRKGIRALLKSEEIADFVYQVADERSRMAGDGYAADRYMTPGRAISSVYPDSFEAVQDNQKNNTLEKVIRR